MASVPKSPQTDLCRESERVLPEPSNTDYLTAVLHRSADSAEAYLDDLIMRAKNLGISVSQPSTGILTANKHDTSAAESSGTLDTNHARTASTGSEATASTTLTSRASTDGRHDFAGKILTRKRSRGLSFTQYESYLAQINPNLNQPKFLSSVPAANEPTPSVFSASTRRSYISIKKGFSKIRRRRKSLQYSDSILRSCTACREDLQPDERLERLPCGHNYCASCLRIMVNQATTDESKMPPRCCTQPIPGPIIKSILPKEDQNKFLKAVLQFSTPWETRVFCSNPACGEFIPPRAKVDPKHPSQVTCRKCRARTCAMCKREAHPIGQDCPDDRELEAVLKMGEQSGWRRCYKCRTLVELAQGCTHMTCRCRAQFCYICGGIWDPLVGCPNFCNGDEELERRRLEEEARAAELEAEEAAKRAEAEKEAAERLEAEKRTHENPEFQKLRETQLQEMERHRTFERKSRWLLWAQHHERKTALIEKQSAATEKMKERHAKTSVNLEDRQVAAEMELRSTLEQSERNVRIRLKHMEAYCDRLGQKTSTGMPSRTVTERDLRELGQQYSVEKNMKQLHQAKINVMRDRQAKALEQLSDRQELEMNKLAEKHSREIEHLESGFADALDALGPKFSELRSKLDWQWRLEMEVMCGELENKRGLRYALMPPVEWPQENENLDDSLAVVDE
ncbi:IBR domain-containing protein [Xylariomycetidae sp. FL0641]|nr:IBR domain-containing protein [Xylariomycetidae sp. FL0641]